MTERRFSAEGPQSSATTPSSKRNGKRATAAKKSAGNRPKNKSIERTARKAAAKRTRTNSRKQPSKSGGAKRGRPGLYPDKMVVRMPKGWLAAVNAKAKAAKLRQGEFLRKALGRAIGK